MVKIFLVGYGKMGRKIHQLAENEGVEITGHSDSKQTNFSEINGFKEADGVIEFTGPDSAMGNIKLALTHHKFVVSGSTGWTEYWDEIAQQVESHNGKFFYASNFSFGANIMFKINELLATMMGQQSDYKVSIEEIHHTQKVDKPSGTAITIAHGILPHYPDLNDWVLDQDEDDKLTIKALREPDVKGTHTVKYANQIDEITVQHKAYSRDGFALGALKAAIWLHQQGPGIYNMKELMKIE